ncbi:MAG: flippase-like domain-containing protein [Planctomycetes bacterium]|nr:flippase-like domain-containing protein [Planctomycetota bacterium]
MKRYLSLALRVVLAIAGVGFIVWSVDWVDRVEVHAGATLAGQELRLNGEPITKSRRLRVVSGTVDPAGQKQDLVVVDDDTPGSPTVRITAADANGSDKIIVRASFITTLRHSRKGLLLIGLIMIAPVYPITAYRWMLLMRARGLEVSFAKAMKLTMVGCFFNYCMPGSTGGDFVKAYYAAARSDRRTDAVMTVIFDRIVGVLGLVLLAGVAGLFAMQQELARAIVVKVWLCSAIGAVGACVYFSHRLRRAFGLDWIIARLPAKQLFAKLDNAAVAYGRHPRTVAATVAMSVPVHLLIASAAAIAGYALGMTTGLGLLLTVLPIIFLSGALPITPQGAGVWEFLGGIMLVPTHTASMNQIVAMLMVIRVYQLVYSVSGGFYLLKGDIHLHPEREAA